MKWTDEFLAAWRSASAPSWPVKYGFAVVCILAATAFRWGMSLLRPDLPFTPQIPAVVLATVLGGVAPGLVACFAGAALGYLLDFGESPAEGPKLALLAIYVVVCVVIIWGIERHRALVVRNQAISDRLIAEEKYRKLVIDELRHRLRNKVSAVHAVVRQALRHHPDAWAQIDGRIRALSASDDLIAKADDAGCGIKELLVSELEPYGHVRYSLNGDTVFLPAKLAASLALMFHELATNAAKYGSFASDHGLLSVSWTLDQDHLQILWDETEGPAVTPPTKTGFGTLLLNSALASFHGHTEFQYLETGLRCTIRCRIPPNESHTA
jgi:two-component sensor histidine kinase